MKVHVLWHDYYEESYIVGIYTEEGKREKIEELQLKALERAKGTAEIWRKKLIERQEIRMAHLQKVNRAIEACKASPGDKNLKREKRQLIKKDEQLLRDIQNAQYQVGFYSSSKMLEDYMQDERLIWLEKEVIE